MNKTEKASEHKRMQERKKGNVFQSKDLISGVMILASFTAIRMLSGFFYNRFFLITSDFIEFSENVYNLGITESSLIVYQIVLNVLIMALPLLMLAAVLGVVMSASQTRMIFATESMQFKFSRINPIEGLKKMFTMRSLVELVKAIAKITIIMYIIYGAVRDRFGEVLLLTGSDVLTSAAWLGNTIVDVAIRAGAGMLVIGVLDFFYQWWEYERSLMMSRQELIDEHKDTEGDPLIRSRLRNMQQKMAQSRMMSRVKDADVVVRNPDHYAVVLKYDGKTDKSPVVVAKGVDYLAQRIIKEAEKYGVYTTENPPLARALYRAVEIDSEIPEQFYHAVADILFYLYEIERKRGGRAGAQGI